jgi:hypothetical protein
MTSGKTIFFQRMDFIFAFEFRRCIEQSPEPQTRFAFDGCIRNLQTRRDSLRPDHRPVYHYDQNDYHSKLRRIRYADE